jgi:hypothetical protein
MGREFFGPEDEESFMFIRHLPELIEPFWERLALPPERSPHKKNEPPR